MNKLKEMILRSAAKREARGGYFSWAGLWLFVGSAMIFSGAAQGRYESIIVGAFPLALGVILYVNKKEK